MKILQINTNPPNITRYIAGVGPLNNIKREVPIIPPIIYKRMYCAIVPTNNAHPRNPANCCDSQQSIEHIHYSASPHKGAAALIRTNTSKRIPIKSPNHRPIVPAPTMGFTLTNQPPVQLQLAGSRHGFSTPNTIFPRM